MSTVEASYETSFVEHAYIEPEAGFAERVGDRVEVQVTTQSPHMDREELAGSWGYPPARCGSVPPPWAEASAASSISRYSRTSHRRVASATGPRGSPTRGLNR